MSGPQPPFDELPPIKGRRTAEVVCPGCGWTYIGPDPTDDRWTDAELAESRRRTRIHVANIHRGVRPEAKP